MFSFEFYKTFNNNHFVQHVRLHASDLSSSELGKFVTREIFCKIQIVAMHSFLKHFRINSFYVYFSFFTETVNNCSGYIFADQRSIIHIWHGFKYSSAACFLYFSFFSVCIFMNEYMNILFFAWKCTATLVTCRKSKLS